MTLTETKTARVSSFDRTGANTDYRPVPPGETLEGIFLEEVRNSGGLRE